MSERLASEYLKAVARNASLSAQTLDVVPPPEGSTRPTEIRKSVDSDVVLRIEWIQGVWSLPTVLHKDHFQLVVRKINDQDAWDWVFKLHAQSRIQLEISDVQWNTLQAHFVAGLAPHSRSAGEPTGGVLDQGTLSSLPSREYLTELFAQNPWALTLCALSLGPRVVFTDDLMET